MGEVTEGQLVENEDYYFGVEGYMIFTEQYHLKRGFCCENDCMHCPYGHPKKQL